MSSNEEIAQFVRQTLGCSCPDEVFRRIESEEILTPHGMQKRITIGDRLLVWLATADHPDFTMDRFDGILRAGIAERDRRGLNRFRLVLLSADPAAKRSQMQATYQACALCDEKVHLHSVPAADAAALLANGGQV